MGQLCTGQGVREKHEGPLLAEGRQAGTSMKQENPWNRILSYHCTTGERPEGFCELSGFYNEKLLLILSPFE